MLMDENQLAGLTARLTLIGMATASSAAIKYLFLNSGGKKFVGGDRGRERVYSLVLEEVIAAIEAMEDVKAASKLIENLEAKFKALDQDKTTLETMDEESAMKIIENMDEIEARIEAIGIKIKYEDTEEAEPIFEMIIDRGRAKSTFYTAMESAGIQAAKRFSGQIPITVTNGKAHV